MPRILRQLREEHADIARLMDILDRQLSLFAAGGRPDYDLVRRIIAYCLDYPAEVHHPKEDMVYRILAERDAELANAVGDLQLDHVRLAEKTRALAEAVREVLTEELVDRAWVYDLTDDFVHAYRRHIRREEQQVFPAAEAVLTAADWASLETRIGRRDDPLFGKAVARHYRGLRDEIEALERLATEA